MQAGRHLLAGIASLILACSGGSVGDPWNDPTSTTGIALTAPWWTEEFPKLDEWIVMRAQFVPPPPEEAALPKSLLERLATSRDGKPTAGEVLELAARPLAPVTTRSVRDGSRFVSTALLH